MSPSLFSGPRDVLIAQYRSTLYPAAHYTVVLLHCFLGSSLLKHDGIHITGMIKTYYRLLQILHNRSCFRWGGRRNKYTQQLEKQS